MNTFIKRLLLFSIGPIGGALISFITIPLTTYFISPKEYGKASMFTLFQTLLGTFLYLGMDQAYTREYHDVKNKRNLFHNALLIPLILGMSVLIFILFDIKTVSRLLFDQDTFWLASFLFGIMIVFMVVERFILLSIRMQEKALEYSVFNLLIKITILIFTLLFVLFIRKDFLAVVYSTAIGQVAGDLYLVIRYKDYFIQGGFYIDRKLIGRLLKFGLPLAIAASVASLLNSLGRLALRTWSVYYEIGIFTATLKVAAILSVIQTSFTSFWVPTAYRWYGENKEIQYYKVVSDSVLFFMSILFFFVLIFKQLIVWLLSPQYHEAVFLLGFLCLQPVMYTISETTTLGIVFSKKSYLNIWVSLLSITPSLLLNIVLVPVYGAIGASIATGVAYMVFFWGRSIFSNTNWTGFPLYKHFWISAIMFASALVNSFSIKNIVLLNVGMLGVALFAQLSTIKNMRAILLKKRKLQWDVSKPQLK